MGGRASLVLVFGGTSSAVLTCHDTNAVVAVVGKVNLST